MDEIGISNVPAISEKELEVSTLESLHTVTAKDSFCFIPEG